MVREVIYRENDDYRTILVDGVEVHRSTEFLTDGEIFYLVGYIAAIGKEPDDIFNVKTLRKVESG